MRSSPLLLLCALNAVAAVDARGQESRPASAPFDLERELARIRPTHDQARWTTIPWRHSLAEACAESARTGKPVYLFVNDGDVESGRC